MVTKTQNEELYKLIFKNKNVIKVHTKEGYIANKVIIPEGELMEGLIIYIAGVSSVRSLEDTMTII